MVFIPLIIGSLTCYAQSKYRHAFYMVLLLMFLRPTWREFSLDHFPKDNSFNTAFASMISAVPKDERSSVWNFNGCFQVYNFIDNGVIQKNRIIIPWHIDLSTTLYRSEAGLLRHVRPKYIFCVDYAEPWKEIYKNYDRANRYKKYKEDSVFITKSYQLLSSAAMTDGTRLYCFKRKQPK